MPRMKKSLLIPFVVLLALVVSFYALRSFRQSSIQHHRASSLEAISRLLDSDSADANVWACEILNVYPHDPEAFTQGLIFDEGFLCESTGLRGKSTLRKVELKTGKILKIHHIPDRYFGEGLTLWKDKLIQLTWKSGDGFIYDKKSLRKLSNFKYESELWGITHDGSHFIVSDGSETLRFIDPDTFSEVKHIEVSDQGIPIVHLNELEYIKGKVFANVWGIDYIARISPDTGQVVGWIDLTGLRVVLEDTQRADALNGIAYDPSTDHIFVTGKRWSKIFEIRLNPEE